MDKKICSTRTSKWFIPLILVLTVLFTACTDTSTSSSLSDLSEPPGSTSETSVSTPTVDSSNSQTASSSLPTSQTDSDNGLEIVTNAQDLFGDWAFVDESVEVGSQETEWVYGIRINHSGDIFKMSLGQDGTDSGVFFVGEYTLDYNGILKATLQQRKDEGLSGAIINVSILAQQSVDDKNSCVFTIQSIETQDKDFNAAFSKLLEKPTVYTKTN